MKKVLCQPWSSSFTRIMVVTPLIWLARVHLFYFSFLLKIAHLDSLALFHPSICFHSSSYSFISKDRSSMFLLFPFTFYDPAPAFSAIFFLSAYVHSFFSVLVLLFLPPASSFTPMHSLSSLAFSLTTPFLISHLSFSASIQSLFWPCPNPPLSAPTFP